MSGYCLDRVSDTALRRARDSRDFSREQVVRDPRLDPPISTKTLERWENGTSPVKRWRLEQLAAIYEVSVDELEDRVAA